MTLIKRHVNKLLSCLNEDIPDNQEDEYSFVCLSEATLSFGSVTTWELKTHMNHVTYPHGGLRWQHFQMAGEETPAYKRVHITAMTVNTILIILIHVSKW